MQRLLKGKATLTRSALFVLLLTLVCGIFWVPSMAHAAPQKTSSLTTQSQGIVVKGTSMLPCQHLEVTSPGGQPITSTCLDGQIARSAVPLSSLCGDATFVYWDANGQGPSICFVVQGSYNMTAFTSSNGKNWNDQASSFQTGCSNVSFFKDINDGGSILGKGPHSGLQNFVNGTGVPNDTLSSVLILFNC